MNYIPDNLMPNEKVHCAAHIHPAIFLPSIASFLLTIILGGYGFSQAVDISAVGAPPPDINVAKSFIGLGLFYMSGLLFLYSTWLGLEAVLRRSRTELAVTNCRLIAKTGVFRKHTLDMRLPTIERVVLRQALLGRLLHFGTMTVTSTDGTQQSFRMLKARKFSCDCCTLRCSEKDQRNDRRP